jgi:hypothetical protein
MPYMTRALFKFASRRDSPFNDRRFGTGEIVPLIR